MAEKKSDLLKIAETSPGIATVAASKNIEKKELSKIAAVVELTKIHKELTDLPQNNAYKKYQAMDPQLRDALATMFSPKYTQQDKGFFGNIAQGIKSSVYYGADVAKDYLKSFSGFVPTGAPGTDIKLKKETSGSLPEAILRVGAAPITATAGEIGSSLNQGLGLESKLDTAASALVRSQEKLVKQPYQAARLASDEGENGLLSFAKFVNVGAKELFNPRAGDAVPDDNSTNFMKYWEQASEEKSVFDENAVLDFNSELSPAASYLGRLLASKKDLVENFEQFQDNPAVLDLIDRYISGDEAAGKEVAYAVSRFEKSKISPGRDYARSLISVLPHEWEKAVLGDGNARLIFSALSMPTDALVTFALDPLIITGKISRALQVAKYGFFKVGEGSIAIEKAFSRPKVRAYWDDAGTLIERYRNGNLNEKSQALTRLQNRFREININVIEDLAKADVRNADDALEFFGSGERFVRIMAGEAGIAGRSTLIPRMTFARTISNEVKDSVSRTLGTDRFTTLKPSATQKDFIAQFSDSPDVWASKIGLEKSGVVFTAKDKSMYARIDRIVRQFEIAPVAQRIISIADGSSATQVYRLARTVLSKSDAGNFRTAWLASDEGERLLAYKGLLKTIGIGMGLDLSNEGRLILSTLDNMSTELYSVSQIALDLGDLADVLKLARKAPSATAPAGVRKEVLDAISKTTGAGKAQKLLVTINAKVSEYITTIKALKADKAEATTLGDTARVALINDEIKMVGVKLGRELKSKKQLKEVIGESNIGRTADDIADEATILDDIDEIDSFLTEEFNAGQTLDGTPRAIRQYQLSDTRSLPDFAKWRETAQRAGVLTNLFGRATNNHLSKNIADGWSFLNLYPRLGLRSTVEEVGMFGVIAGAEGFGFYLKGRLASRSLRAAEIEGTKINFRGKEKIDKNLGFIYDNLYKLMKKHYTKDELVAMAEDPELMGAAVANSMIRNRFKPGFLQTKAGNEVAGWAGDFAEFNGKSVMDDINGSVIRAERPMNEADTISNSLQQFGPSVRLNIKNQESLKGLGFSNQIGTIASNNDKFVFHWLLELNNTIGKRNGQFGNIVLWNVGKKQEVVIQKLVKYIEGPGNDIAKRYAIYGEQGAEALAANIFLDSTLALRNSAGQINMDLVNAIRTKGGMEKFSIDDLIKLDSRLARPESVTGRELIPITGKNAEEVIYRVINSGYGWMGKQISLLDREPITLANYFMFRKELKGTQAANKQSLIDNGMTEAGAESVSRFAMHETAMGLARNRTLSFVDNGDVRTNLAFSLRTMGRYYRATEDFYRRLARLGKYEKRGLVRLAIANQSFEDSGFIHQDDRGQMYFTYPGDDLFAETITRTLSFIGITSYTPTPVNFGGYVKMLTPSLDPESWKPGLSNPFISISLDGMSKLPYIGTYIETAEKYLTGSFNTDIPAWEKAAPANVKRAYNFIAGSPEGTASRFSSAVKAIKLLVSTGNGPTKSSDLEGFYQNVVAQAKNIDAVKLFMGQGTIASIQSFGNKDVPKELINAGVFTWDSEFQKIMKKFDGDKDALSKSLVMFAKLYPSKIAYTNFATKSGTMASFRKTIEAENFVRKNEKFLTKHSEAGSFFIPVAGETDFNSYSYLKKKGYILNQSLNPKVESNKQNFIREVATTEAKIAYYALNDEMNAKIAASQSMSEKRYWREQLASRKNGLFTAYPLLRVQVIPTTESNAKRIEYIDDMKSIIREGSAPNKELSNQFGALISEYEKMNSILNRVVGSSDKANEFKKNLRSDTKDVLLSIAEKSDNARTFYYSVIEPLIGD
jgi:hypothetical protein